MSKLSTFVGFYSVSALGIKKILVRSAIEVPAVKVAKGPASLVVAADLAAEISTLVEDNELIPVTVINPSIETDVLGFLSAAATDASSNNVLNSIKIGLKIEETGSDAGKGVLVVTTKISGVKTVSEILIEAVGE